MEVPEKLLDVLEEIKEDCLNLKARNDLTDFGKGELFLILRIEELLIA